MAMSEKIICDTKRAPLFERIPLETPFSIYVFPSTYCNFKCIYCLHSQPADKIPFKKALMSYDVFTRGVDGIAKFPDRLKSMIFVGMGEPLFNGAISEMVAYAKKADVAEKIEIVTNGSLLTHDMSDRLIDAGLDRLRISVEGLSAEKYRQVAGASIDFDRFVENIRYFYDHRTNTSVYIKIIETALDSKEDEARFYEMFGGISDETAVECLLPYMKENVEYLKNRDDFKKSKDGEMAVQCSVCPFPFYTMSIDPEGAILGCPVFKSPVALGNVADTELTDAWNSPGMRAFQRAQLRKERFAFAPCRECVLTDFLIKKEDRLDDHCDLLLTRLNEA